MDEYLNTTRRKVVGTLAAVLGLIAIAEIIWIVISFFKPRSVKKEEKSESIITAGSVDDFKVNSVTAFIRGRFYLSRLSDGGFIAMSCACTHLGCTVTWEADKNRFECPCHASSFDIKGDVINPPAPRALDYFPVSIENNVVQVDTGTRIKRNLFDKMQLVRHAFNQ